MGIFLSHVTAVVSLYSFPSFMYNIKTACAWSLIRKLCNDPRKEDQQQHHPQTQNGDPLQPHSGGRLMLQIDYFKDNIHVIKIILLLIFIYWMCAILLELYYQVAPMPAVHFVERRRGLREAPWAPLRFTYESLTGYFLATPRAERALATG